MSLSPSRLDRLDAVMTGHTGPQATPGMVWLVDDGDDCHVGSAGTFGPDADGRTMTDDTIFRISSMTKPVVASLALTLVEDAVLGLDDAVDRWLPELADRRVAVDPHGDITQTVPAERPITVEDLLTFRSGYGMDFTSFHLPQPLLEAVGKAAGTPGPPMPQHHAPADAFLARLADVPLAYQPGERWLYHHSAELLGVLVARAVGRPLGEVLAERLLDPLGMGDTGFSVPPGSADRIGPLFGPPAGAGEEREVDDPAEGQWATPPPFESGGDGLVSTVHDVAAFARFLRSGGSHAGRRLLSRATVAAMTTDHLSGQDPTGDPGMGWGWGLGVRRGREGIAFSAGCYGWDGGLGSGWTNDPTEGLIGILLTNEKFSAPALPASFRDFWTLAYAALD